MGKAGQNAQTPSPKDSPPATSRPKKDHDIPTPAGLVPTADYRHIAFVGIMSSTTGGIAYWQAAMWNGFIPGMCALLTGLVTFILLIMCMAELSSTIPLSGGSFGFVRVSVGPQLATVAGVLETLTYIFCAQCFMLDIYQALFLLGSTSVAVNVVLVLLVYVAVTAFLCLSGSALWRFTLPIGVIFLSLELVAWFICLSMPGLDLNVWSKDVVPLYEGPAAYFSMITSGLFYYVGVESMALSAEDAVEPRKNMPLGMLLGFGITAGFALITPIIFSSAPPGLSYILLELLSQKPGFDARWPGGPGLRLTGALAFIEATITLTYGTHGIGRIIYALARGGLFPKALSQVNKGAPMNAIIVGAGSSYLIFALMTTCGGATQVVLIVNYMCSFTAVFNYILVFISFILLRLHYKQLPRKFYSPLGLPGAWGGLSLIIMVLLCMFIYTPPAIALPSCFIVISLSIIASSYWIFYAQFHVGLTPEEVITVGTKLTAAKMLQSGLGYDYLMQHCQRELNTENLHCVKMIQEFFENPTANGFIALYTQHLGAQSKEPANVTSAMFAKAADVHDKLQWLLNDMAMGTARGTGRLNRKNSGSTSLHESSDDASLNLGLRSTGSLESHNQTQTLKRGQAERNPEVKRLLTEDVPPLLQKVEAELMSLIEKDILPRFKATKYLEEYLQKEPVLFKELSKPVDLFSGGLSKALLKVHGQGTDSSKVVPAS